MIPGVAGSVLVAWRLELPVVETIWKRDLRLQARIGASTRHAQLVDVVVDELAVVPVPREVADQRVVALRQLES
jgi:hypothetical protein